MDEDEAELQALSESLSPSTITTTTTTTLPSPIIPPPPLAPLPPPPPIAPIPSLPPSLLRPLAAAAAVNSDSDRESSLPPPPHNNNIYASSDYEISEESRLARERQEKAVQELLLKRRAYAMAVPTNDSAVRARLRRLNEPITLFGEREMERRDRLRSIMVRLEADGQLDKLLKAHDEEQSERAEGEAEEDESGRIVYPFYTEGSKELVEVRREIARFSVGRAMLRIKRAKRRREDPDEDEEGEAREACNVAGEFVLECSEIGDDRPLSGCSFSRDGMMLATR